MKMRSMIFLCLASLTPCLSHAQSIPLDQKAFTNVVSASRQEFSLAKNDLVKGGTRPKRAKKLCNVVSGNVTDWVGKIYDLSTNSEGRGVLSIEIPGEIWFSTWNNSLSDIGDNTLIDPSSLLFENLSEMSEGQQVTFSGELFASKNNKDCLKEQSLTMGGAMTEPEFVMKFSSVNPL